jgi:hypothetical protein
MEFKAGGREAVPVTVMLQPRSRPAVPLQVARVKSRSDVAAWGRRFALMAAAGWVCSFLIGFERAVLVLSFLGLAAAIAGLRQPIVGLFGVGILCTMDVLSRSFAGGLWRWNTFNYLLLLVIALNFSLLLRSSDRAVRVLQVFAVFLFAGLAITESHAAGAQHILDLLSLFGLLIYFRRASLSAELAYWLAIVMGILGAGGGLLFNLWKDGLPWVNPNAWSLFPLAPLFAACLAFYKRTPKSYERMFLLTLAAVNGAWVFLSGSRGGLGMAIVCTLFLLLQVIRSGREVIVGLAIAAVVTVFVGSAFIDGQSRTVRRVRQLFDSSETMTERSSGRSDLALGAWYIFLDHPFGVGTGGFSTNWAKLGNRKGLSGFDQGEEISAHSGWAKTLAENGLIGFGLLAGFVVSFPATGWRRAGARGFVFGGLVAAVLSLGFLVTEFQSKGLWFLAAGAISHTLAGSRLTSPRRGRSPAVRGAVGAASYSLIKLKALDRTYL